jgi:Transposase IS4
MPNKPITQGYKIYGIADHGYIYNFLWSSREKGLQDIVLQPDLTKTGCLVKNLALSLPRRRLTLYMDNYFTSIPLFSTLRACEFGAVGTTRPHKDLPPELKVLKERFATKLEWNTLLAKVVDNTLCLAWQDNNIVLALSNIHTVNKAEDFCEKLRRRPAKTSTNARIVRQVFGEEPTKELQIPRFIDDYNRYMGGVDLANQFRESYETHRITQRTWWPLFYWFIDVVCVNSYRLYCLYQAQFEGNTTSLTHLDFRVQLASRLLDYSTQVKLQYLKSNLGGKRVFSPEFQSIHYWIKRPKQENCKWCLYTLQRQRVLNKGAISKDRAKRSRWGCVFCNVALCQEGECWSLYHSNNANY